MFDCSPPPRKPVEYSPQAVDYMCRRIYTSEKSVDTLYREDENFPSWETVVDWMVQHPEVRDRYLEAKKMQVLYATDNMLEVANCASNENWCQVQAVLNTKKWMATKLLPAIFGEKAEVKHTHVKAEEWIDLMKEPETIMIEDMK